jgi:hypothetical protein
MKAIRILGLAAAGATVVLLLSMLPALAQPIAGAYYGGEITGCDEPPCGTVHFRVSPAGSQVQDFTAFDVPGHKPDGDCLFSGPQVYPDDLGIVGDSFGPGGLDWYQVSGSFPSEGSAQGTLRLTVPGQPPPCDTGVLDWTAIQSAVGGIAVLPDVSGSPAPNYISLAGLAAAALVALTAGGWHARGRFR